MTKKAKPTTEKPNPDAVQIRATGPDDADAAKARGFLRPTVTGAVAIRTAHQAKNGVTGGPSIEALINELSVQCKAVTDGSMARPEAMLTAQAHTLDTLFSDLVRRAYSHTGLDPFERIMRLALRVQNQSRATVETLAAIKNPPMVFAKQANVTTGPQQVNNGQFTTSTHAGAREIESRPNKLLEQTNGERMETRAASGAGRGDTELETVGTINRAANG